MARGWESKSVEAQIEASNSQIETKEHRNAPSPEEVQGQIKTANLNLSRRRILQQLEASTNDRYSELLRRALADLNLQIENS